MLKESAWLMIPICFPILMGLLFLLGPKWEKREELCRYVGASLVITAALVVTVLVVLDGEVSFTAFPLTQKLPVYFKLDRVGRLFVSVVTVVWLCAGLFSFEYMKHEHREQRYYGFYLIVYGVLIGLDFAGNLITFYIFYELMTLLSMPLVLHSQTKEAVLAGMKYLFYSFAGAYMALFGLYFLNRYTNTLTFTAGGVLNWELIAGREGLMLTVAFIMLLGFGVKAGMFPLHGWLTTAHPVAPAPASAALSGIIVKSGVLAAIRVVYYLFGTEFLRGTWVQTVWLILILVTVLMGSMMAYREKKWKKRLAYSTVSQVSYILLGLAMLQPQAFQGALLHTVFHAFIKSGLFLVAGAMITYTGKDKVADYAGIGRRMPVLMTCYTVFALALIGIPPFSGFLSKWYLAVGSLDSGTGMLSVAAPAILLVSALLTAGYLLPVAIRGFLPGEDFAVNSGCKGRISKSGKFSTAADLGESGGCKGSDKRQDCRSNDLAEPDLQGNEAVKREPDWKMLVPVIVLAVLAGGLGILTQPLLSWTETIAKILFGG